MTLQGPYYAGYYGGWREEEVIHNIYKTLLNPNLLVQENNIQELLRDQPPDTEVNIRLTTLSYIYKDSFSRRRIPRSCQRSHWRLR